MKNNYLIQTFFLLFTIGAIENVAQAQKTVVPISNRDTTSSFFSVKANDKLLATAAYKDIHYASFQQSGEVIITIQCTEEIKNFTISPLSKNIQGRILDKKNLCFRLAKPSYIVVKINNKERLFLFAEELYKQDKQGWVSIENYNADATGRDLSTVSIQQAINETAQKKQTLFFPAGIYKSGSLFIPSNANIVLEAGALLKASDEMTHFEINGQRSRGFINIINAENINISGYGTIDGNGSVLRKKYEDKARLRLLFLSNCKNISIQGVTHRDPGSWNTQVMYSDHIQFNAVKLLNDPALANTDGFDPDASSFVTIENCFAYCGDDNVAIKITQQNGLRDSVSNIVVKGCVFLTRKSSLKVGTESRGVVMKNILFEDNDVIMSDRGMALYCSDGATYENIRYFNNRFEENYPDSKRMGIHFTINKRNPDSKEGVMKNIVVDKCTFYTDFPKPSEIAGLDDKHGVEVKISNLIIGQKRINTLAETNIKTTFAQVSLQ
ncbi:MAG TPA: glycosyl hydrolase family 28 protein [Chitinophagaceae bacterium]